MNFNQGGLERVLGSIPVSIGTSLAFETNAEVPLFTDEIFDRFSNFNTIYLNVRTLLRNVVQSFKSVEVLKGLSSDILTDLLIGEIHSLRHWISQNVSSTVIFYVDTYESLKSRFPHAVFRETTSVNAVLISSLELSALQKTLEFIRDDITHFSGGLHGDGRANALVLTHQPIDLLGLYTFGNLALLESHTGEIKTRHRWNSKLLGKPERIPFDRMTLQLIGDNHMFRPFNPKAKRFLIETAEKYAWSTTTTKDMMIDCVRRERDPSMVDIMQTLYRK